MNEMRRNDDQSELLQLVPKLSELGFVGLKDDRMSALGFVGFEDDRMLLSALHLLNPSIH